MQLRRINMRHILLRHGEGKVGKLFVFCCNSIFAALEFPLFRITLQLWLTIFNLCAKIFLSYSLCHIACEYYTACWLADSLRMGAAFTAS